MGTLRPSPQRFTFTTIEHFLCAGNTKKANVIREEKTSLYYDKRMQEFAEPRVLSFKTGTSKYVMPQKKSDVKD